MQKLWLSIILFVGAMAGMGFAEENIKCFVGFAAGMPNHETLAKLQIEF